jgi:hypothetical protein
MSDTAAAPTPTDPPPYPLSDPAPIPAAVPAPPAATPDAPTEPPPVSAEPPAGVMPPADGPTIEPAAEAPLAPPDVTPSSSEPAPAVEESTPPTGPLVTSPVVDTPEAAIETLGDDAGIRAPAAAPEPPPHVEAAEHPHVTIARIREKLAAYGAECLETVRHEIELLHNWFDHI